MASLVIERDFEDFMYSFGKLILSSAVLAAVCLAMIGGCPLDSKPSDVRFVNMATSDQINPSNAVLGSADFGNVSRYGISTFQSVNSGDHNMVIKDSVGLNVYTNSSENIPSDHTVNLVSVGNSDTAVSLVKVGEPNDSAMPGAGEIRVHFVNGCDNGAVDIYILPVGDPVSGTPVVSNLPYLSDTVITRAVGPVDFVMCPAGTTTIGARVTHDLLGGQVYLSTLVSPSVPAGSPKKPGVDFHTYDFFRTLL